MIQSQEEHELKLITFDQNTLVSTSALDKLSERTLAQIATCIEPHIDTWLCKDHAVKVVFIKAATDDNAAVHLSAIVPATSRPSIESFLELQLEEPGTETKPTVRDVLGLDNVTGAQLKDARKRNKCARQILVRTDLHVQRDRKRRQRSGRGTADLDKGILDLDHEIDDHEVETRRKASTKKSIGDESMLSNDGRAIHASDVGTSNFARAAVWITWWRRSFDG